MTTKLSPDWRDDSSAAKRLYLLAGANGSGKSTIARLLLPAEGIGCVNPDDIARELNPSAPGEVFSESLYRLFTEEP